MNKELVEKEKAKARMKKLSEVMKELNVGIDVELKDGSNLVILAEGIGLKSHAAVTCDYCGLRHHPSEMKGWEKKNRKVWFSESCWSLINTVSVFDLKDLSDELRNSK
jgi:hypothetical protein